MNLILFETDEIARPLRRDDPRAKHIVEILHGDAGRPFDVGLIDGPRGKGIVEAIYPDRLHLSFTWGDAPPPLVPITLVVGMPRPQTARKILNEATSLGVASMEFFTSDKGEASYGMSSLWKTGEWRRHLISGAEQAFCTRLPCVRHGMSLETALRPTTETHLLLALDNYEAEEGLCAACLATRVRPPAEVTLALGPERGWSSAERALLRVRGCRMVHLGSRVLRLETAVVASVALARDLLFCCGSCGAQ